MENSAHPTHDLNNFIFDLDGVIWRGNAPIDGAVESISQLKAAGKRCFFCTNNSRQTPADFATHLREIGIEADDDEVMTSSTATVLYLQSQFTGPFTAYVVGEEGLIAALRRTGAIITTSPIIPQRSDLHESHGGIDCVIVGIDATFSYHKMRLAQRLILGGARFIATNRDSTFPTPHGIVPGAGAIVASIETATGISPVVLGKPQPLMLQLLVQKFGLVPEETAMVGDRLDTDMTAAHRAGIQGLFVATGVHSMDQARRAKSEQKPDGIYEDLPSLCQGLSNTAAKVADVVAAAAVFNVAPTAGGTVEAPETAMNEGTGTVAGMETSSAEPVASAPIDESPADTVTAQDVADASPVDGTTKLDATPNSDAFDAVFNWDDDSASAESAGSVENAAAPEAMEETAPQAEPALTPAAPQPDSSPSFAWKDEPVSDAAPSASPTAAPSAPVTSIAPEPSPEPSDAIADAFNFFESEEAPVEAVPEPVAAAAGTATEPTMEQAAAGTPNGDTPADSEDDKWWESLDKI